MPRLARLAIISTVLAMLAVACSSEAEETTTTSSSTTTTTSSTTTTTTEPLDTTVTTFAADLSSPLNGLEAADPELLDRPVFAVKIDNHPQAVPQSGLSDVDAVIELPVEGGFTRFIALYHATGPELIGPVRSLRPSDPSLVEATGAEMVVSGTQDWIRQFADASGVRLITSTMFRLSHRIAPHNLYADTELLRGITGAIALNPKEAGPLFDLDDWDYPEDEATTITIDWSLDNIVEWQYDVADQVYLRSTNGEPHDAEPDTDDFGPITTDVVVILTVTEYLATPPEGVEGTPVPAFVTVGSGDALVFTHGRVWSGTWEREHPSEPFRLLNADGSPAPAPAGRPWVSIVPDDRSVVFE